MSDSRFKDLLPPEVREHIEELEAAGISMEEQGAVRSITPRHVAPPIATDDIEQLFGVTEDPQDGKVYYLQAPPERDDDA